MMFLHERKLRHEYLSFVEKPAEDRERSLATFLFGFFAALNQKNIQKVCDMMTPEAQIDSRVAGGIVSREEYHQVMELQLPYIAAMFYDGALLTTKNETEGEASGILTVTLTSGRSTADGHRFYCIRDGEEWLITKTQYI